jgi:hypothetical protein
MANRKHQEFSKHACSILDRFRTRCLRHQQEARKRKRLCDITEGSLCREAGNFTSSRIRQVRALISGTSYARIPYPLGKCPFYVTPSTTLSRNIANSEEHDKVDEIPGKQRLLDYSLHTNPIQRRLSKQSFGKLLESV